MDEHREPRHHDTLHDLARLFGRYNYLVIYIAVVTTAILVLLVIGGR